jgi:[ribosomal protein S5]-alanine N-acetyltransferase
MIKKYFDAFLNGEKITLQPMSLNELNTFAKIDNETGSLLLTNDDIPFPGTSEDQTTLFQGISGRKETFLKKGQKGFFKINWKNSTCHVGISIGEAWQHKGFGTDAMQTFISFILNYISLHKIKLQVFSFNNVLSLLI